LNGFLLIDKPCGPSSFAVVNSVKKLLKEKKAGHSGTLDPAASGLLIIALGNSTRLLPYIPSSPKKYHFGIRFGKTTNTLDSEGVVDDRNGLIPTQIQIEQILCRFTGAQMQVPPKFSAVKIDGKRAYDLARKNIDFEIKEKPVEIYSLSLAGYDQSTGEALCDMTCSQGTYVRSLVRDMAAAIGTIAYASSIRRCAIGSFTVDNAVSFDTVNAETLQSRIVKSKDALSALPGVMVDDEQCLALVHGKMLQLEVDVGEDGVVAAFDGNNEIAAILKKKEDGGFWPEKVFVRM